MEIIPSLSSDLEANPSHRLHTGSRLGKRLTRQRTHILPTPDHPDRSSRPICVQYLAGGLDRITCMRCYCSRHKKDMMTSYCQFFPAIYPSTRNRWAPCATYRGHVQLAKYSVCVGSVTTKKALFSAAEEGRHGVVGLLLPIVSE